MKENNVDEQFKTVIRKLIIQTVTIGVSIWFSVMVMQHGWGLEVKSWWWIIGVGVFGRLLAEGLLYLGK